jgi:dTDP-glucose pyrophosphorylase
MHTTVLARRDKLVKYTRMDNQNKAQKTKEIQISSQTTILQTIRLMDTLNRKLLIVNDGDSFLGVVSIGDIQRAIIKNIKLDKPVSEILRSNFQLGSIEDDMDAIIDIMITHRTEFMPILDKQKVLRDVIFWEDIVEERKPIGTFTENIPVVIMAGGKGTRLKPITNIIPKPLLPIGDRAFLEIIMDSFKDHGLNNFLLSVLYKADLIKHYFDQLNKDFDIKYILEEKPLGTAGSLHLMAEHLQSAFFVSNCDIIVDQDYTEIYKYHKESENELTMVAAIKTNDIAYGTLEMGKDGQLIEMKEKPQQLYYVNAGLYILEAHLLKEISKDEVFHITDLIEKILERKGRVGVFPVSEGAWMDIGEWKEYDATQKKFDSRFNR